MASGALIAYREGRAPLWRSRRTPLPNGPMPPMDVPRRAPASAVAETVIDAPLDRVWSVLAGIEEWPRWNPDVSRAELRGPLTEGSEFRWRAGGMTIVSTLRMVEPPHRIGWSGRAPGIRAAHVWILEERDGRVLARSEESFTGWLPWFLPGTMQRMLAASLERGVAALRAECERREG
jgi:uncharacterized protein YndB with AHSA1/START domain